MNIREKMLAEKERLEAQLAKEAYDYEMANYPEGSLRVRRDGKYSKLFWVKKTSSGTKAYYIRKKDRKTAETMAKKMYKKQLIQSLRKELKATNAYLHHFPKRSADEFFIRTPEFRELLQPLLPNAYGYKKWSLEEYTRNPEHPERLIFPTMKGEMVRSKSEAMIADELYRRGIPYRYECLTDLGGHEVYPDFTIINPDNGAVIIWEHFGRMDDPDYVGSFLRKMYLYVHNGYIPTINFITTYENGENPLTQLGVVEVIDQYFGFWK